jgi:hypothetical protein
MEGMEVQGSMNADFEGEGDKEAKGRRLFNRRDRREGKGETAKQHFFLYTTTKVVLPW